MLIIIFGPPGCGKGTQSALIANKYKLKHISTGDLLRNEIQNKTEFGIKIQTYLEAGKLVPDQLIIDKLMLVYEHDMENYKGIILDGFPRTTIQAEALEKNLKELNTETTVLLDLKVDNDELLNRLLYRGESSGRIDDNLVTIKKRLQVYEEQTLPVKYFYKEKNKYAKIEGVGTIAEIFRSICTEIDRHLIDLPTD